MIAKERAAAFVKNYPLLFREDQWFWREKIEELLDAHKNEADGLFQTKPEQQPEKETEDDDL